MSHTQEFILRLSQEGREWAKLLHLPAFFAFVAWHLPQPKWMKRFKRDVGNGDKATQ